MSFRQRLITFRYNTSERLRSRRFQFFWDAVGHSVSGGWWLDLGGGPGSYFLNRMDSQANIVLLDLLEPGLREAMALYPSAHYIVADGQHLPFKDSTFACIFCNSVIEHVPDPGALANEIRRTGRRFFVQTPNGNFWLESHSALPIPFYRRLPSAARRAVCRLMGISYSYLESVEYISEAELRAWFPGAEIERERVWGMTKSYYIYNSRGEGA